MIGYRNGKILGDTRVMRDMIVKHILDVPSLKQQHIDAVMGRSGEPEIDNWLKELEQIYMGFIAVLCNNRARLRRKLRHLIVMAGTAELRAEKIDINCFNSKPPHNEENFVLSYYVIHLILRMMHMFLTLGFELQLYHVVDYLPVYWYLEYVTSVSISNLHKLNTPPGGSTAKAPRKKNKKKRSTDAAVTESLAELDSLFSRAYVRYLIGLLKLGYTIDIDTFGLRLGTAAARFEQRFTPFQHISQPPPAPYERYVYDLAMFEPIEAIKLFHGAAEHFQAAIRVCDKLLLAENRQLLSEHQVDTVQGYHKVATQNMVTARISAAKYVAQQRAQQNKGATPSSSETRPARNLPQFDFSHSSFCPVIKPL